MGLLIKCVCIKLCNLQNPRFITVFPIKLGVHKPTSFETCSPMSYFLVPRNLPTYMLCSPIVEISSATSPAGNLGADWDRNPKSKKNGAESLFVSSFCACSSGLVWASRSQSKRRPMQESLKKFPANANACNPLAFWKRAPPSLVECYVCSF